MPESVPTLNARLHALVAKIHPTAIETHDKTGAWPAAGCPFVFDEPSVDVTRLRITDSDGGVAVAVAADAAGAVAAMEEKLK